jgi:polyisoprenoid-binding protein YceI
MKNLKTIAVALIAFVSVASFAQVSKKVDVAKSTVNWVGKKVTGEHSGNIMLKEGALIFKGKKVVGGNFTVDMTTINTTDLEGKGKTNLDTHLKSDDFFGIEKYPTASLVFKSIGKKGNGVYSVTGDLTIKGKTESIKFELNVAENTATAALKVNRTKYDIKYGSGSFFSDLGDRAISDDFDLTVKLAY